MYLHSKATAWYQLFSPVHSPHSMDNDQIVPEKDHEGPTGAGAGNVEDTGMAASRLILTEAKTTSDDGV